MAWLLIVVPRVNLRLSRWAVRVQASRPLLAYSVGAISLHVTVWVERRMRAWR